MRKEVIGYCDTAEAKIGLTTYIFKCGKHLECKLYDEMCLDEAVINGEIDTEAYRDDKIFAAGIAV